MNDGIILHDEETLLFNVWDKYVSEMEYEEERGGCLLYTSPSPRDRTRSRMPSSA